MSNETNSAPQVADAEKNVLDPAQVEAVTPPEPAQETAEELAAREAEAAERAEKRQIKRERKEYYELKAKADFLERQLERQTQTQDESEPDEGEDLIKRLKQEIAQEYEQKGVEQKKQDVFKQAKVDRKEFGETVSVFTQHMAEEVLNSDVAPKLVKFFYDNPEEAERIAELPVSRQLKEIWKLEQTVATAPQVKKSGAPAPISTISGGKTGDLVYRDDMSPADYKKWTEAQHKLVKSYR